MRSDGAAPPDVLARLVEALERIDEHLDAADGVRGLADLEAANLELVAPEPRHAATLALLTPRGDELEIVYTRRQSHLTAHAGQLSFPGGRIDEGETPEEAAVREAVEEVALDPASIELLGALPRLYIPPSQYWMTTVLARWDPHPLTPSEAEVAEVLHVSTAELKDPERWRGIPLTLRGWSWAWQLDDERLLWGATAIATSMLLALVDPTWSRGAEPDDLPPDRILRPWEGPGAH